MLQCVNCNDADAVFCRPMLCLNLRFPHVRCVLSFNGLFGCEVFLLAVFCQRSPCKAFCLLIYVLYCCAVTGRQMSSHEAFYLLLSVLSCCPLMFGVRCPHVQCSVSLCALSVCSAVGR